MKLSWLTPKGGLTHTKPLPIMGSTIPGPTQFWAQQKHWAHSKWLQWAPHNRLFPILGSTVPNSSQSWTQWTPRAFSKWCAPSWYVPSPPNPGLYHTRLHSILDSTNALAHSKWCATPYHLPFTRPLQILSSTVPGSHQSWAQPLDLGSLLKVGTPIRHIRPLSILGSTIPGPLNHGLNKPLGITPKSQLWVPPQQAPPNPGLHRTTLPSILISVKVLGLLPTMGSPIPDPSQSWVPLYYSVNLVLT